MYITAMHSIYVYISILHISLAGKLAASQIPAQSCAQVYTDLLDAEPLSLLLSGETG